MYLLMHLWQLLCGAFAALHGLRTSPNAWTCRPSRMVETVVYWGGMPLCLAPVANRPTPVDSREEVLPGRRAPVCCTRPDPWRSAR